MNHAIKQAGLTDKISCDSAGTSGYHVGAPPDRRMSAVAKKRGITLKGRSRKLHPSDLERFDLILAMDKENYQDIIYLDLEGKYADKVRMICDFAPNLTDEEVPDPYYGGEAGFDYVIDLLLEACSGLLEYAIANQEIQQ